jgi:transcription elongation GreA/GreB family factor/transcription elongation factor GreA-like protein
MLPLLMDAEIQKAVEAGTLSSHAADTLKQLQPGTFCLHKSWGFGQIESINFLLNQVTIDFRGKKGHTMQLQYAAESLQPLPPEHILSRKSTDLPGLKKLAKEDPIALVRLVLASNGGRATQDQLARALEPELFNETEFKRWWESTKRLLKKDGHFAVPAKKSESIELREAPVSRGDDLLAAFFAVRHLKDQLNALDQISKDIDAFSDPTKQLEPVLRAADDIVRKSQRLHPAQAFEILLARDEIAGKISAAPADGALTLVGVLREEDRKLQDILPSIPAAKQKRVLAEFPNAFGDAWVEKALNLMVRTNSIRLAAEFARLLQEQGKHEDLRHELDRSIRDHSISTEVLLWLCKERDGEFGDLITPQVFSAILTALERDQFNEVKRGSKLHDLLLEDRELVSDLLISADAEIARDSMRRLLLTPVFEELNKRSLMGRIIKVHPDLHSMLDGESGAKQEALIVSWESLEKRKNEYEELINRKIPENTKEIRVARSYGDLRENFEFKAAKEMQRVLMRRKAEMEQQLTRARGTNFENPDTAQVSIGTVVTVRNLETSSTVTYTILGAWDGQPEQHILSYQAALGQALLGKKVGDEVELLTETGTERVEIVTIGAYRSAPAELAT